MSGLVKAKKYDWKDSNLALFGSDSEKKVVLLACRRHETHWICVKIYRTIKSVDSFNSAINLSFFLHQQIGKI